MTPKRSVVVLADRLTPAMILRFVNRIVSFGFILILFDKAWEKSIGKIKIFSNNTQNTFKSARRYLEAPRLPCNFAKRNISVIALNCYVHKLTVLHFRFNLPTESQEVAMTGV